MKLILKAAIAAGTLALAACNGQSDKAENILANSENVAENFEAVADNMSDGAAADLLDNKADVIRAEAQNTADAADAAAENAAHAEGNNH
jgi:hypothetical protein